LIVRNGNARKDAILGSRQVRYGTARPRLSRERPPYYGPQRRYSLSSHS